MTVAGDILCVQNISFLGLSFNMQLAMKGELMTHNKDKAVLLQMQLKKLVEKNFSSIGPDLYLGELVKVVAGPKRNIFPVVDQNNLFLGIKP